MRRSIECARSPDAVQRAALAAWCTADPGSIVYPELRLGPGSAVHREERCTASGTRELRNVDIFTDRARGACHRAGRRLDPLGRLSETTILTPSRCLRPPVRPDLPRAWRVGS